MMILIGKCYGYHKHVRTIGQNEFTDHQVLIEVEQINQYGIPEIKTTAVKLSKKHMETGFNNLWDQLKGKQVSVPVFVGLWVSKAGKAGFDLWLAGEGKPLNLQQAQHSSQVHKAG